MYIVEKLFKFTVIFDLVNHSKNGFTLFREIQS